MHRQSLQGWVHPDQSSAPLGLRLELPEQGLAQQVALAPADADPVGHHPVKKKPGPGRKAQEAKQVL
jgi:hypothetical protein